MTIMTIMMVHDDHGEGAEMPPILDLKQTRIDLEAGFESPFEGAR